MSSSLSSVANRTRFFEAMIENNKISSHSITTSNMERFYKYITVFLRKRFYAFMLMCIWFEIEFAGNRNSQKS